MLIEIKLVALFPPILFPVIFPILAKPVDSIPRKIALVCNEEVDPDETAILVIILPCILWGLSSVPPDKKTTLRNNVAVEEIFILEPSARGCVPPILLSLIVIPAVFVLPTDINIIV